MNNNSITLTKSYDSRKTFSKNHSHFKPYEELNLMDSFLFETVTENPENAITIAKPIIERATGRRINKLSVHPQKDLKGININAHGIRMDVYAEEYTQTPNEDAISCVYDIEPNNYHDGNLPRRNRYYQSLIDSKLLPVGDPYKNLPDMFSIWLLPYDPFGDNRILYTVKNTVAENNQIVYNDGVTKLFLYTKGTVGGSQKLKQLLNFMENSTQDNAVDKELSAIYNIINTVKNDSKERDRYMGIMGVIDYEKRDSYNAGIELGRSEGVQSGIIQGTIVTCKSFNQDVTQTKSHIMTQFNLTNEKADEYISLYW